MVVTTGLLEPKVVQSSSQIITTNKPTSSFLQAGCPSCCPTNNVKALKENITSHGLAYPKLTWGLPTLSLPTKSSWLPWERVAMPLISPLMPVPQYKCKLTKQKQKVALINSTKHIQKPMLRERTDRTWFSLLLQHPSS